MIDLWNESRCHRGAPAERARSPRAFRDFLGIHRAIWVGESFLIRLTPVPVFQPTGSREKAVEMGWSEIRAWSEAAALAAAGAVSAAEGGSVPIVACRKVVDDERAEDSPIAALLKTIEEREQECATLEARLEYVRSVVLQMVVPGRADRLPVGE
jgi:hypothetical protein